jgi:hypothetical protein
LNECDGRRFIEPAAFYDKFMPVLRAKLRLCFAAQQIIFTLTSKHKTKLRKSQIERT